MYIGVHLGGAGLLARLEVFEDVVAGPISDSNVCYIWLVFCYVVMSLGCSVDVLLCCCDVVML